VHANFNWNTVNGPKSDN